MSTGPELALLFSGGKDSAIAALLLEPHFEVTLVTCDFGVTAAAESAAASASCLALDHQSHRLPESVLDRALEQLAEDGYPNRSIQLVHEAALEAVARESAEQGWVAVADGTRRDDRAPTVSRAIAQSLEDRHGIWHLAPLAGIGRGAIDALVSRWLEIESGPSETVASADYEGALRQALVDREGAGAVQRVFPPHTQSRVVGRY